MARTGTLYLIPAVLGEGAVEDVLPTGTLEVLRRLEHYVVEDAKTARAFLKRAGHPQPLQTLSLRLLNEHTRNAAVTDLLEPLLAGNDCGLLSEAGCPGVADPGAALVRAAHECGIRVRPLVGPSSILLAIMAAGLNGQRFTFHGYLPVNAGERARRISELERQSQRDDAAQVFIETPYRNIALLDALTQSCRPDTLLSIACDLTDPQEEIATRRIDEWRKRRPSLDRRPAVFALYRGRS